MPFPPGITGACPATAPIEAHEEATVVAKVGGEVRQIYVEEGDAVQPGQLLARLDGDRHACLVHAGVLRHRAKPRDHRVEEEVLGEDRPAELGPGSSDIVDRPAETVAVGEHAQGVGDPGIATRDSRHVGVGTDRPGRGRGLLYLENEASSGPGDGGGEASPGLEKLAEDGDPALLLEEAREEMDVLMHRFLYFVDEADERGRVRGRGFGHAGRPPERT